MLLVVAALMQCRHIVSVQRLLLQERIYQFMHHTFISQADTCLSNAVACLVIYC